MSLNEINTMIEAIAQHTLSKMPKGDGMTFGTVQTLNPLSIKIDNMNFVLPEEFFFLGQWCRPFRVTMPHKHEYNGKTKIAAGPSPHEHEIEEQITENLHEKKDESSDTGYKQDYVEVEIIPKLKEGDRVLLFAFNGGQKYYVAERIEKSDMWDDMEGLHDGEPGG